jgi:hypothetical protein
VNISLQNFHQVTKQNARTHRPIRLRFRIPVRHDSKLPKLLATQSYRRTCPCQQVCSSCLFGRYRNHISSCHLSKFAALPARRPWRLSKNSASSFGSLESWRTGIRKRRRIGHGRISNCCRPAGRDTYADSFECLMFDGESVAIPTWNISATDVRHCQSGTA